MRKVIFDKQYNMANKRVGRRPRSESSSKSGGRRLSNVVKPPRMDIREWQTRLRANAAESESLGLSNDYDEEMGACYRVVNSATKGRYSVFYYGEGNPLNRCGCMDFRTSRISTCKHIEAVKANLALKRKRVLKPLPDPKDMSLLYVDYSEEPRFAIYYGASSSKLRVLARGLFDSGLHLRCGTSVIGDLNKFVQEALACGEPFHVTEDAQDLLAEKMSDAERRNRLDALFHNDDWLQDVFCQGIVPYEYQIEGIRFASLAGRCIIADEMGLGKTIQAIGAAVLLNRLGFVSSVLIVCPTSLKYQWLREIKKFSGIDALVVEGNPLQRMQAYRDDSHVFKIVSYNALSNDIKSSSASSLEFDMVVVDEVQRLKNWNTQAARGVRKLKSEYRIILTGTPLENKLEDLFSIVQLVDQNVLGPFYIFRNEHIVTDESGKVTGYIGLNTIAERLKDILIRRRKSEISIQLPERIDKNLFVVMTPRQMEVHEEFRASVARIIHKWRTCHFLSENDRRRLLLLLSQMRMVCDSTYILDQTTRFDTKVDEVLQIVSDVVASGDEKIVVFSQWERMTRLIAEELDKAGIGYSNLNGTVPSHERKSLIDSFTDKPEIRVFLSTDAGSTGLNLQAASYVINVDLPWNPAVLEQRIGRVYRIGQERKIQVINMIAPGTIEEQMLSKLHFKASMAEGVLDGGSDEVSIGESRIQQIMDEFDFSEPDENCTAQDIEPVEESEPAESIVEADQTVEDIVPVPVDTSVVVEDDIVDNVIRSGASFFDGLVSVLSDPEKTVQLVDKAVQEDPETGELTMKLPIKGKKALLNIIKLMSSALETE